MEENRSVKSAGIINSTSSATYGGHTVVKTSINRDFRPSNIPIGKMFYFKVDSWLHFGFMLLLLAASASAGPVTYGVCYTACIGACETGVAAVGGAATGGVGAIPAAMAAAPECLAACAATCAWALIPWLP